MGLDFMLLHAEETMLPGRITLEQTIPILARMEATVNSATAALGSILDLQAGNSGSHTQRELQAGLQYEKAVRSLQQSALSDRSEVMAFAAASLLLACVELLLRRRQNALAHLRGAYGALQIERAHSQQIETRSVTAKGSFATNQFGNRSLSSCLADDLELLCRTCDVQMVSYSDGARAPDLAVFIPVKLNEALSDSSELHRQVLSVIHSSYGFISDTACYKYLPGTTTPRTLLIKQGRHLAALECCLISTGNQLNPRRSAAGTVQTIQLRRMQGLSLQSLLLSTRIRVSRALDPLEVNWDKHANDFETIVENSGEILTAREQDLSHGKPVKGLSFTPLLGIIQPLYLTSMKYRNDQGRRRAIGCLRRSGREGPWLGELLAAVATRAAEIESGLAPMNEETTIRCAAVAKPIECLTNEDVVSERQRICICRMAESNGDIDTRVWPAADQGITKVKYFRRRWDEPGGSASSEHNHGPDILNILQGIQMTTGDIKWTWEVVEEILEFHPSKAPTVLHSLRRTIVG